MPNLDRLARNGARGVLTSMDPTASAIVWTTIATGKDPDKHGIRGFIAQSPSGKMVPVTSNMRQTKAIWNIAGEQGVTVGFLAWWVTWPAEKVRGFMCSDYTWPLRKSDLGFATGAEADTDRSLRTFPAGLADELDQFVLTEDRLTGERIDALGISAVPNVKSYAVRDILLKDISVAAMSDYLLDKYEPSLFAVYFDGFDAFCHSFWPQYKAYMIARTSGEAAIGALPAEDRQVAVVLETHLIRLDGYVGKIMARARPNDVVMVISDHGYGDNPENKPILRSYDDWIEPPHWHTLRGIFVTAGGPIRREHNLVGASVRDITPTVLALLGLPVAQDMDGRVLKEMLTDDFLTAHPVTNVDTYETGPRGGPPIESEFDEAMIERLRSLGYVE
jgi:predicted AlkP superfamily phosphohydrolase/phosphomutase